MTATRRSQKTFVYWHYPIPIIKDLFQELYLNEADFNPYEDADLFVVVRNPYDRMISEYYYEEGFKKTVDVLNSVKYMNRRIRKNMLLGKKFHFKHKSGHYIPQYDYVYDSAVNHNGDHDEKRSNNPHTSTAANTSNTTMTTKPVRIVKYVLRYENLQNDFDQLMKKYNVHGLQLNSNKGKRDPVRRRKAHANLTKYDLSYHNCLLIEQIYEKDFTEFGYNKLKWVNGVVIKNEDKEEKK